MTVEAIRSAVAAVCDPEYPDVTIEELGILEMVGLGPDGSVLIELVPTVLGCPALDIIEADVIAAARSAGAAAVTVRFLAVPVWSAQRIAPAARDRLAREYTVAIRRPGGSVVCPLCGSAAVEHRSDFGATPCRSVAWCQSCRNPVEVLRR